jgi:uncharacterized protein (DUF1697 family)
VGGTYVALIRGINVGRAKRVAMADLRALFADLGYRDARTLLASGNVVFTADRSAGAKAARRIETAMAERLGVPARVTVLTAATLAEAIAANPLGAVAGDPARLLVAVLANPEARSKLEPLVSRDWTPEAVALGNGVAYLWCPNGVIASALAEVVSRIVGDGVTMRNWSTMTKLVALATGRSS